MQSKVKLSILALILANIIWGASFPIYKWSLDDIPPFSFAFLRFYIGALVILPFVLKSLKVVREDWTKLILASLFSVTIQIPLLFLGLELSPSINAPIIISSGPIFLVIFSIIFMKEKINPKVLLGTLISLMGVLVIILRPALEVGFSGGVLGNLFFFLATMCSVAQALFLKKLTVKNDPMTITFWLFLIGSLPLVPLFIRDVTTTDFISNLSINGGIGLFYGIVLAAVLAHYLYALGIKYIKTSEVGIFTYVDPIATVIVALPLLHEEITFLYLIGALFVFLGIFIAEERLHYHPVQRLFGRN